MFKVITSEQYQTLVEQVPPVFAPQTRAEMLDLYWKLVAATYEKEGVINAKTNATKKASGQPN